MTSFQQHGLTTGQLQIPPETMLEIGKVAAVGWLVVPAYHIACAAAGYTREAGVRCLEREIASLCRTVAVKVVTSYHILSAVSNGCVYL